MVLSQNPTHILAFVADVYTPILLIVALFTIVVQWKKGNKFNGLYLVYAVLVVYMLMFVDHYFQLWVRIGLDYSTHTAVALAFVIFIGMNKNNTMKLVLGSTMFIYCYLMFALGYHSWSDMMSTALVIGIFLWPVFRMSFLRTIH